MIAFVIVGIARLLSGSQARWVGCEPSLRQRVYFANHSSHLDFVVLWAALPGPVRRLTRPIAARDYWEPSRIRRYFAVHVFNAGLVTRGLEGASSDRAAVVAAATRSVEEAAVALGDRYSLILFPEGTRGAGREVGPFKSGLYYLARMRPDVELVPAYLENLNRILPKGEVLPVPFMGSVSFGAPIALGEHEPRDAFLTRARDALLALRPR